jgi:hypothetical protein
MRRTLVGLMAAGALLVAGCGGDDDGGDDTGGGGGGSSDEATQQFCEEFQAFDAQFRDSNPSDEEVSEAIRSLEPPDEIADDYEILVEGLERLATLDSTDPDAATEFQEDSAQYTEASTNVRTFVQDECGVDNAGDGDEDPGTGPGTTGGESSEVTTGTEGTGTPDTSAPEG